SVRARGRPAPPGARRPRRRRAPSAAARAPRRSGRRLPCPCSATPDARVPRSWRACRRRAVRNAPGASSSSGGRTLRSGEPCRASIIEAMVLELAVAVTLAQTPQPFPRPGTPSPPPATSPPAKPPAVAPPTTPANTNDVPTKETLGVEIYPGAEFLQSYDAG